jgi:hypothetical protein
MLSIIGIKKTIKQHTADMDITDSVNYKISAPPRFAYIVLEVWFNLFKLGPNSIDYLG